MEQIISYVWLFVDIVVYAVDTLSDWLVDAATKVMVERLRKAGLGTGEGTST